MVDATALSLSALQGTLYATHTIASYELDCDLSPPVAPLALERRVFVAPSARRHEL